MPVTMREEIDTSFDFRRDTPAKRDPDSRSAMLRRYHQLLWSKSLPSGEHLDLAATTPRVYLHHKSEQLGEFWFASDSAIPTFTREGKIRHVTEQIPSEVRDRFNSLAYTIGGMMLWPGQRVGRKATINGARGLHPRIKDRFDLTVECVSRHYAGTQSPLTATLGRYAAFFSLFGSFQGFVEFFLLQDLVDTERGTVNLFTPFRGFDSSPLPQSESEYRSYMADATQFIGARNDRIQRYWEGLGA